MLWKSLGALLGHLLTDHQGKLMQLPLLVPAGPCEALLTTANLLIVLGLRDALRGTPPANKAGTQDNGSSSSGTADTQATQSSSSSSELACEATAHLQHQRPVSEPPLSPNPDEGLRAESPLKSSGPHSPGLATDSPKVASHHMLPPLDSHPPKRGPGILRVRSTRRVMSNAHRVRASCRGALSRAAVGNGQRHVSACRVVM